MVASVVFIFLLDHLPDLPHTQLLYSNQTSDEYQHSIIKVEQCETQIADRLVQIASKELRTFLIPHWRYNGEKLVKLLGNLSGNGVGTNGLKVGKPEKIDESMNSIEFNHFIEDELTSQMIDDTSDCDEEIKANDKSKLIGSAFFNHLNGTDVSNFNYQYIHNKIANRKMFKDVKIDGIEELNSNSDSKEKYININNDNDAYDDHAVNRINKPNFNSTSDGDIKAFADDFNKTNQISNKVTSAESFKKISPVIAGFIRSNAKPMYAVNVNEIRTIDEAITENYTDKNIVGMIGNDIISSTSKNQNLDTTTIEAVIVKKKVDKVNETGTILSEIKTNKLDSTTELTIDEREVEKVEFPPNVPYLVAMFESLANVTAQTCGGTLVAPEWVLTAASCVNVLRTLYNRTDKENTTYTIILDATNPLLDGYAYNVTEIMIHPQSPASSGNKIMKQKQPVLALMRIQPSAYIEEPQIEEDVKEGVDVMVYGWILVKNESGHDVMRASSFPAVTLSPLQCRVRYGMTDDNALCLDTRDAGNGSVSQMTSGGPVVVLAPTGPRLLALAVTDAQTPLLAAPLGKHARWMRSILRRTT